MGDYRLYFMDRFSGHIEHRREFVADDDAHAIGIAEEWNSGQPMELWTGSRKLKRWDPDAIAEEGLALKMVRAERQQQNDGDRNADQPQQDGAHLTVSYLPARPQE